MKELVKTKKEIEKAQKSFRGYGAFFIGLGIFICFFFIPLGLIIILFGIVGSIMGFAEWLQNKRSPPSYIPNIICPYCQTSHDVLPDARTFVCSECKNRVLVQDNQGQKISL